MRRFKRTIVTAGVTAVGVFLLGGLATAQMTPPDANNPAVVDFNGSAKKGTLSIRLGPQQTLHKTNNARVSLDSGIKVNSKFVPDCTTAQLEGLDPAAAQANCGPQAGKKKNALVATGDAIADVGGTNLNATALAFAGPGEDIIVYARVEALSVTQIINCTLTAGRQGGFGAVFNCPVPPLAGGAGALESFNLLFDRSEKVVKKKKNGKKKKKFFSVVSGTCPSDGSYDNQVEYAYDDAPPETVQYRDAC
jgi:hypothetical protein